MMSYKDNRYRDTYTHTDTEPFIIANSPMYLYRIVEKVELRDECIQKIAERVVKLIKDVKAEVEPVKHGKWIKENIVLTSLPPKSRWHCSVCGSINVGYDEDVLTPYCSNCGAKMDEEQE